MDPKLSDDIADVEIQGSTHFLVISQDPECTDTVTLWLAEECDGGPSFRRVRRSKPVSARWAELSPALIANRFARCSTEGVAALLDEAATMRRYRAENWQPFRVGT